MLTVTDLNGITEALSDFKDVQRTREVNGEYSLSFLLFETDRNAHSFPLVKEESVITLEEDLQEYRIKKIKRTNINNRPVKFIEAHHVFFDLIDNFIYTEITNTQTMTDAVTFALNGSGYTFDIIDAFPNKDVGTDFGNKNSLKLLDQICELYGAEIERDNRHLTFRTQIGVDAGVQIRFGYNIKAIDEQIDSSNLSTYIKGYGKKDEETGLYLAEAEYTSPNASIYGIKNADPVYDERFTDSASLQTELQTRIIDTPEVSLVLDFLEMRKAGFPFNSAGSGDTVYVIHEILGMDLNARAMKVIDYPDKNDPRSAKVTLSNLRPSLTDVTANLDNISKKMNDLFTGTGEIKTSLLEEAVRIATRSLQNASTELEFPEAGGIIGRSKIDPNDLTVFNSNGIGISNDGGQTFREAITADGFVLSAGVIGKLGANNIKTEELIVGTNISMGANAYISWNNVLSQPFIPTSADQIGGITASSPRLTHITSTGIYTGDISATTGTFTGALSGATGTFAGALTSGEITVQSGGFLDRSNFLMMTGSTYGIRLRTSGGTNPDLKIMLSDKGNIFSETRFNLFEVNANQSTFTKDVSIGEDLFVSNTIQSLSTIYGAYLSISQNASIEWDLTAKGNVYLEYLNGYLGRNIKLNSNLYQQGTYEIESFKFKANPQTSYFQAQANSGLRVQNSSGTYQPCYASSYPGASKREWKMNIRDFEGNALDLIETMRVRNYQYKGDYEDLDSDGVLRRIKEPHEVKTRTGLILEEAPEAVTMGEGVEIYALTTTNTKGIQELHKMFLDEIAELKARILTLEGN
jgi:phage minor structural protein